MKTTELRVSFLREADEAHPYTAEEIAARIEASLADEAAGEVYTSDEVKQQMERKYPFLCK